MNPLHRNSSPTDFVRRGLAHAGYELYRGIVNVFGIAPQRLYAQIRGETPSILWLQRRREHQKTARLNQATPTNSLLRPANPHDAAQAAASARTGRRSLPESVSALNGMTPLCAACPTIAKTLSSLSAAQQDELGRRAAERLAAARAANASGAEQIRAVQGAAVEIAIEKLRDDMKRVPPGSKDWVLAGIRLLFPRDGRQLDDSALTQVHATASIDVKNYEGALANIPLDTAMKALEHSFATLRPAASYGNTYQTLYDSLDVEDFRPRSNRQPA
ncbi:MAG: hypothetical protein EOO24_04595 [Comamonadaceae bacterium]|nr:MAG: hypothetical protein EOO24_04595 [Comamonadaceae bacterium]